MKFTKVTGKSMFKPSFGAKRGTTEFYQATEDGDTLGEIEIKPGNPLEIMSVFSDYRNRGVGRFLVEKTIESNPDTDIIVRATDESFLFWKKMGFVPYDGLIMVYRKKHLEHINFFKDFEI
jgi:GNAT superfamily N-acetyltransferase